MRLIIAGGRTFTDLDMMTEKLDALINLDVGEKLVIISGTARGADHTGERYAALRGYEVERYPAEWALYGRSAGYRRNEQMANTGTHCAVFWDGQSRGSKNMIDLAQQHGLELRIIRYIDHNGANYEDPHQGDTHG